MTRNTQLDQLEAQVRENLKEGDILFISINAFLYKQVARGTGSWCSHVGFVVREQGEWYVLESAVPVVKRSPLRKYLARTCNNEVAIRRLKSGVSAAQVELLKVEAQKRMGRFYHLGFQFDSKRQFCSKFVHECFRDALGIELGKVETLEGLLEQNPQASVGFWRAWYFGFIPWQRRTLTPASQLADDALETVFATI
ncbi:YiiX/YebB-like N1pC/P60 family cysteine hydrolase [Pontibacterium granulatum]|uniref:YiiX/YebB-like N1pC/P60 family cysteine hydrolase n=1 Tax=Pontibacterium granulatum TaxID=2036029 RepID=UPI00249A3D16|nr:YiiX/YebB-like N1pC/P60 family cysteine hydrolase [Pontibacterium granulatum]MDI3325265.1 YiiX/YebB-like N1pC/P60 family cysteine hydrolase [Pontibacterium granulatum]